MKFSRIAIILILSLLLISCTKEINQKEFEEKDEIDISIAKNEENLQVSTRPEEIFEVFDIDQEHFDLMKDKSFHENSLIGIDDLSLVKVTYWGFDEETQYGELVVNRIVAEDIVGIFKGLYENRYPIEKIQLVSYYDGDDNLSMEANNTSAFNFRLISGSDKISNHSYGLAVDINPAQNPYVSKSIVLPKSATSYVDRTEYRIGMILGDDICVRLFKEHGWTWGGNYNSIKDYQHFEIIIEGIND